MNNNTMDRLLSRFWVDDDYITTIDDATYRIYDLVIRTTTRIGMSRLSVTKLGWYANQMQPEKVQTCLDKLQSDGKIHIHNNIIIIVNHYKYWDYSVPNSAKGAINDLSKIMPEILDSEVALTVANNMICRIINQHIGNPSLTVIQGLVNRKLTVTYGLANGYVEIRNKKEERRKEKREKRNEPVIDIPPSPSASAPVDASVEPISPEIQELLDHAQSCVEKTVNEGKESGVLIGKKSNHTMILTPDHLKTFMSENDNDTDMVKAMLTVFYQWKTVKATRVIKSDYLSMREVWVKEAAHKYLEQNPPPHDMRKYWSEGTLVTTDQYMNVLLPLANGNYDILNSAIEIADQAWRESKDKKRKSVNYVRAIIERRMS